MPTTRRDFFKQSSIAAAALAVPQRGVLLATPSSSASQGIDSFFKEVCILALDAARGANASYADVRIISRQSQYLSVVGSQLEELNDAETLGIGVRALVNGAWGFSASNGVTRQEGRIVAEEALRQAPGDVNILNNASNLFVEMGDAARAGECLGQILSHKAPTPQVLEMQVTCFSWAGNIEQAARAVRKLVEIDPGNVLARHRLAALSGEDVPARASDDYIKRLFDTFAEAKAAADSRPESLTEVQPWIRPLATIQSGILEAESLHMGLSN